jgi:hypothetical protein
MNRDASINPVYGPAKLSGNFAMNHLLKLMIAFVDNLERIINLTN